MALGDGGHMQAVTRGDDGDTPRSGTPVLVLGKVRAILDAFTPERPHLSLTDIRLETGLPASTCLRLLLNMCNEGFLSRSGETYGIGVKMLQWSAVALEGIDVVGLAGPVLRGLRDQTRETACLFVRHELNRTVVALAGSPLGTVRRLHVGEVLPLHAGSAGKVLLAHSPEAMDHLLLATPLASFTPHTIVDAESLRREVDDARDKGFAMSVNEGYESGSSISAPVFDNQGSIAAAVCLGGPTERFNTETMQQWVGPLVEAANGLTRQLGGRPPAPGRQGLASR